MSSEARNLIRAAEVAEVPEMLFRHPLNPASEIHMRSLSGLAGLERAALHLGRVPPGKESFAYHFHHFHEEWVYVLSGRGVAEIGEETVEVGPGDVMLFRAPSPGHHLKNPFDEDLVYLMGGERGPFEIGEFPRHGKRAIFTNAESWLVEDAARKPFFEG